MTLIAESESLTTAPHQWSVRFLFGQKRTIGESKSHWRWIGEGKISIDRNVLNIVGRRHRYFRSAAKQEARVGLYQVCNVLAAGRLVRFEVNLEGLGEHVEVVRLRTDSPEAAQEIATALPKTRSAEFERAHNEKLAYDRSVEELGTRSTVTSALVAINVAWFVFVGAQGGGWVIPNPGVIIHWGANFGPLTLNGEWWRLFTCTFVHFGLVHLFFNMWVLWGVGRLTERLFGSFHYAVLYFFAGLCGSMASLWWHPNVTSAGASGAIFGVLGGLLAFVLNPASRVPRTIVASQRRNIGIYIAYTLVGGIMSHGVDNAAHLGGLGGGFLMGWLLARPLDLTAREQTQTRFALAALLGFAGLSAAGWHVAHQPHPPPDFAYRQSVGGNRINFSPGQHRRVVLNSGERISQAMAAVYAAQDTSSLGAAIVTIGKMADSGDAEAAFRLGRYYHLERSEPDYEAALRYYERAANANHAWAANNIGLMYRDGLGVPRNEEKAHGYLLKAAGQKNPWAYINLAEAAFDKGGNDSVKTGLDWLEEGGHNNCTMCLIEEAAIYHSGSFRIARDPTKTLTLLNKAAALGDDQATLILAEMHIVGDGVPQSSRTAFDMLKTLSDNGDAYASTLLGELSADDKIRNYLFETTLGGSEHVPRDLAPSIPQDTSKAIQYWERATRQGSCQSWVDLSSIYDRGVDVPLDARRAADDVEKAVSCDPGNSFYLWKFAMRYFDAKGRDHDCVAAERLLQASLDHGYADAAVNLGYIYDKGCEPIVRDDHRALQIYLLGAKLGVALCENNVGAMIKHGRGVETADLARGYGWIKLAALHGNDLAKANLQDSLFTPSVRAAGMVQLVEIQARLSTVASDPKAIMSDPWH